MAFMSRVQLGFSALRDLAVLRPPVRQGALDILLSLATHTGMYFYICP